jgi:hypothetical protein
MKNTIINIVTHTVMAAFTMLGYLYYHQIMASPDQQLFDYVGWHMLNDHALYLDVFEINFPIKPAIHMVAIEMFGAETWSFRTLDYAMNVLVALAGYAFLRYLGYALGAVVFVPVYLLSYVTSGAWFAGQIDHTAHAFLFIAMIFLSLSQRVSGGVLPSAVGGGFTVLAFLIKPTMLVFPVAAVLAIVCLGIWEGRGRRALQTSVVFLFGFVLILMAFVVGGIATGQLSGFWQQAVTFNTQVYGTQEAPQSLLGTLLIVLRSLIVIAVLGFFGFLGMSLRRDLRTELTLFAILLGTILVSYFYQNKGFGYHLGGIVILLAFGTAFLIGVAGEWLQADTGRRLAGLSIVAICLILVFAALGKKIMTSNPASNEFGLTSIERQEILDIIAKEKSDESTIIIWGRHYHVGMLSGLSSAWPFINVPLREGAHRIPGWRALAATNLETGCPRFAMVTDADLLGRASEADTLRTLFVQQLANYLPAHRTGTATLYINRAC